MKVVIILVSLLSAAICVLGVSYEGFKVYSVSPTTTEQINALASLEVEMDLDFWDSLVRVEFDRSYRVMVKPTQISMFESEINKMEISYTIISNNVAELVVGEKIRNMQAKKLGRNVDGLDFSYFWHFDEIEAYLNKLATDYPTLVKVESLGKTHEEHDIHAVKISKTGEVDDSRPVVIVEGTIHAREWIGTMICMHLISELVENSEENNDLLDGLDWIIVPVMNVDGFKHTYDEDGDRFWRKNRSPITVAGKENCFGVDLNRNFRYKWEVKAATSNDPCNLLWPGLEAQSEKETKIISNLLEQYTNTVLFLDVHSYGNYLLYPWSYDYILTDTYPEHDEVGERVRQAIYDVNKRKYSMGNSAFTLYRCSGVTTDFAVGVAKIPLAWTIELPGGGSQGFDIEPEKIQSVIDETFPAFREFALFVQERYVKNK